MMCICSPCRKPSTFGTSSPSPNGFFNALITVPRWWGRFHLYHKFLWVVYVVVSAVAVNAGIQHFVHWLLAPDRIPDSEDAHRRALRRKVHGIRHYKCVRACDSAALEGPTYTLK